MSKALQHRKRHSVTTQNRIPITSTLTGLVTLFRPEGGGGFGGFCLFHDDKAL